MTTANMKRLGHIFAMLTFAFVLLMSAVGGTMAHVTAHTGPMEHHGSQHAPSHSTPSQGDTHKAALVIVAPCCPAAEAPSDHVIAISIKMLETSWHPRPEYIPSARDVAPEPHPPKTSL